MGVVKTHSQFLLKIMLLLRLSQVFMDKECRYTLNKITGSEVKTIRPYQRFKIDKQRSIQRIGI